MKKPYLTQFERMLIKSHSLSGDMLYFQLRFKIIEREIYSLIIKLKQILK